MAGAVRAVRAVRRDFARRWEVARRAAAVGVGVDVSGGNSYTSNRVGVLWTRHESQQACSADKERHSKPLIVTAVALGALGCVAERLCKSPTPTQHRLSPTKFNVQILQNAHFLRYTTRVSHSSLNFTIKKTKLQ